MTDILLGRQRALEILEAALAAANADQAEARLTARRAELTRFANSAIHQNASERDAFLEVRVAFGRRVGRAATNVLAPQSIRATVHRAEQLARQAREDAEWADLPGPFQYAELPTHFEATAACGPEQRARAVVEVIASAARENFVAAGAFETEASEVANANSRGLRAYRRETRADLNTVVMSGTVSGASSGYARQLSRDVATIKPQAVSAIAADKCGRSQNPTTIEPGDYEVILEPECVATMLGFLGFLGFGARAYQEQRSFMCGRLGERICGQNVTIWDNGLDARGWATPFDAEGAPKQRVELITDGVARGVVFDTATAARESKSSTGHAMPGSFFGRGPVPTNLFLQPRDATIAQMLACTRRGLLVTRFHYTNTVHPIKTIITGMTRDGTFLIQDGAMVGPVRNLRFTQSILEALSSVELIGRDLVCLGAQTVPALKIGRFTFTGVTEH